MYVKRNLTVTWGMLSQELWACSPRIEKMHVCQHYWMLD